MKKQITTVLFTLFIIYCIAYPQKMATGAATGLALWYHSVVPTLLPFSILSYIIIQTNLYHAIFSKIRQILPSRSRFEIELLYPILFGYLFGFPIGAKLIADLYEAGHIINHNISKYTACCTQFGPAFVINYIGISQLHGQIPSICFLISIYLPSICILLFLVMGDFLFHTKQRRPSRWNKSPESVIDYTQEMLWQHKIPASRSYINFKTIDTGIINGFETMLRIAGYIVLFSILSEAFQQLPGQHVYFSSLVTGLLEVTTGVNKCAASELTIETLFFTICGIVSFGGLCGLFQVKAIMKNCPFHLSSYITIKLICAITSAVLANICILIMK